MVVDKAGSDAYGVCMKRVTHTMPVKLHNKLRRTATDLGIGVSELLRRMADEWYENRPGRESVSRRSK